MEINLNAVNAKLERLRCPKHRKTPSIPIIGSDLNFRCCCKQFEEVCKTETQKVLEEEITKSVHEAFNDLFKF